MAKPQHIPIKLSAWAAAIEYGVTVNKVKAGLKAVGIEPGEDGKYSLREIAAAIFDSTGLKSKAAEARYQKQINEAQMVRDKVLENKGELIKKSDVTEFLMDAQTVLFQIARHSKLS